MKIRSIESQEIKSQAAVRQLTKFVVEEFIDGTGEEAVVVFIQHAFIEFGIQANFDIRMVNHLLEHTGVAF